MASRDAPPEALRRIKHALSLWNVTGYVRWDDQWHIEDWMAANLDGARFPRREIGRLLSEHVEAGGPVKEQDSPPEFSEEVWYSVVLNLGGVQTFIKFVLNPDEEDDPGIFIVRVHDP